MSLEIKPFGARPTFPTNENSPKHEIPGEPDKIIIENLLHCKTHLKQVCGDCNVDYSIFNFLSKQMEYNGTGIPAPSPEIAKKIGELKNVGNTKFRNRHFNDAITKYTEALTFSNQRPPWDSGQLIAEESSVLLCNRVACFLEVEKYREAYWDTEVVVRLKRNWGKGYFRRGKALIGMGCYKEAVESLELAHVFDPTGQEIKTALESAKKML